MVTGSVARSNAADIRVSVDAWSPDRDYLKAFDAAPADFWRAGGELAALAFRPRAPAVADAVPRQLGPLPPEAGGPEADAALARDYAVFTRAAERLIITGVAPSRGDVVADSWHARTATALTPTARAVSSALSPTTIRRVRIARRCAVRVCNSRDSRAACSAARACCSA